MPKMTIPLSENAQSFLKGIAILSKDDRLKMYAPGLVDIIEEYEKASDQVKKGESVQKMMVKEP
jgi:hypothetical protein